METMNKEELAAIAAEAVGEPEPATMTITVGLAGATDAEAAELRDMVQEAVRQSLDAKGFAPSAEHGGKLWTKRRD